MVSNKEGIRNNPIFLVVALYTRRTAVNTLDIMGRVVEQMPFPFGISKRTAGWSSQLTWLLPGELIQFYGLLDWGDHLT
jgi:hypothetical protein